MNCFTGAPTFRRQDAGAAELSKALSALGMGLGLTPGIGVVLSLGVCSYFGVRHLFKKL